MGPKSAPTGSNGLSIPSGAGATSRPGQKRLKSASRRFLPGWNSKAIRPCKSPIKGPSGIPSKRLRKILRRAARGRIVELLTDAWFMEGEKGKIRQDVGFRYHSTRMGD